MPFPTWHLAAPHDGGADGHNGAVQQRTSSDPNRRVRLAAVAEACARGDDQAVDLLQRALDDEHRLVRFRALEGLGRVGGPRALTALLARMDDETQPTLVRRLALNAVVRIGTPEAADALEARIGTYSPGRGQRFVTKRIAKMRRSSSASRT